MGVETIEVTEDNILEEVDRVASIFPDMPPFETVRTYFKVPQELCLMGLADEEYGKIIALEAACREYHVLPYAGGVEDQPTGLLQAFDVIRETQNEYQRIKWAEDEAKRSAKPTRVEPKR